jgi:1-acyl-sn-glycerol-3-phosphate acyltransferase
VGSPPNRAPYIVVAAPHTSRWDAIILASAMAAQRVPVHWLGKDSLFRWPFGIALRALGGIPVDRSHGAHALAQAEHVLSESERPVVIFPEGTRARQPQWKSGFYRLAMATEACMAPVALDYAARAVRWGAAVTITGDAQKDMDELRHFFAHATGCNPERVGPIRIAEEDTPSTPRDDK